MTSPQPNMRPFMLLRLLPSWGICGEQQIIRGSLDPKLTFLALPLAARDNTEASAQVRAPDADL